MKTKKNIIMMNLPKKGLPVINVVQKLQPPVLGCSDSTTAKVAPSEGFSHETKDNEKKDVSEVSGTASEQHYMNAFSRTNGEYIGKVTPPPPPLWHADHQPCAYPLSVTNCQRTSRNRSEYEEQRSSVPVCQYFNPNWFFPYMYPFVLFPGMPPPYVNVGQQLPIHKKSFEKKIPRHREKFSASDSEEGTGLEKKRAQRRNSCKGGETLRSSVYEVVDASIRKDSSRRRKKSASQPSIRRFRRRSKKTLPKKYLPVSKKIEDKLNEYMRSSSSIGKKSRTFQNVADMAPYFTDLEVMDNEDNLVHILLECRKLEKLIDEQHCQIDMLETDLMSAQNKLQYPPELRDLVDTDISGKGMIDENYLYKQDVPLLLTANVAVGAKQEPSTLQTVSSSSTKTPTVIPTSKMATTIPVAKKVEGKSVSIKTSSTIPAISTKTSTVIPTSKISTATKIVKTAAPTIVPKPTTTPTPLSKKPLALTPKIPKKPTPLKK